MEYKVNYPVAFHTVDIAIMRINEGMSEVLLVQKVKATEDEKFKWRFPGGFIDVTDNSAALAAFREAREETGMIFHVDPEEINNGAIFIGSAKIDDPRYRDTPHGILTSFFQIDHKAGEAGEGPFDDVARTKWFPLHKIDILEMNPIHKPLFDMLFKKHKIKIRTNEFVDDVNNIGEKIEKGLEGAKKAVDEIIGSVKETVDKILK